MPGSGTSGVEVTHLFAKGMWILVDDEELLLAFDHFPWFRHATIDELCRIERVTPDHLRWPSLDVDLTLDSIRRPLAYPMMAQPSSRAAEAPPSTTGSPAPATGRKNVGTQP
jgi:hypothetical protein